MLADGGREAGAGALPEGVGVDERRGKASCIAVQSVYAGRWQQWEIRTRSISSRGVSVYSGTDIVVVVVG